MGQLHAVGQYDKLKGVFIRIIIYHAPRFVASLHGT